MLLAVAGLDQLSIQGKVQALASGDWSEYDAHERRALFCARRMTLAPFEITEGEIADLQRAWGGERALELVWHISWCNFMTRVADAFQIPLESSNVFLPPGAR